MPAAQQFSAEMVRSLPDDGRRYETVYGELLVTPSPSGHHQLVSSRLTRILDRYLEANGIEALLTSPSDISWGENTLVQPDLFVADLQAFIRSGKWADIRTLELVIEILSPSSLRADRFTKRRLYQERRIPKYWVIDTEQKRVEVWRPDALFPVVERDRLTWRHPSADTECVIELRELFNFE